MLLLISVFELVLLKPMYERNKVSSVQSAAEKIEEAIGSEDIMDVMFETSLSSDVCIRILSDEMNLAAGNMGCALYRMDERAIQYYENLAKNSANKEYLEVGSNEMFPKNNRNEIKEVILTKYVEQNGEDTIIMVNTNITPIDATNKTLKTQILYISIIFAILIVGLTFLLNHNIVKPLVKINESAKDLAEGKYVIDEKTNQYLEAQELNETLSQAASDIQKADQAKRDLIANVSHDLRTPLTMIGGYGEMMRDLPGEKTDENIQVIIDESTRLKNLVNDLLDLSKLQEQKIELHRSNFDIGTLINRELKKYEVYHNNEGFDFIIECPENIIVNADEQRIEQVINNFITNAINYSKDDKRVMIKVTKDDQNAHIEVQDFGEGIPEERLPYIWDRYYKIDREHVRASSGSGLGLAIVKQILELHDVPFGVRSKENEGSTFYFDLPISKE